MESQKTQPDLELSPNTGNMSFSSVKKLDECSKQSSDFSMAEIDRLSDSDQLDAIMKSHSSSVKPPNEISDKHLKYLHSNSDDIMRIDSNQSKDMLIRLDSGGFDHTASHVTPEYQYSEVPIQPRFKSTNTLKKEPKQSSSSNIKSKSKESIFDWLKCFCCSSASDREEVSRGLGDMKILRKSSQKDPMM